MLNLLILASFANYKLISDITTVYHGYRICSFYLKKISTAVPLAKVIVIASSSYNISKLMQKLQLNGPASVLKILPSFNSRVVKYWTTILKGNMLILVIAYGISELNESKEVIGFLLRKAYECSRKMGK